MTPEQQSLPAIAVPARRGRRSRDEIERDWYGCFAKWTRDDRAGALKVLTILHEQLPDKPAKGGLSE